MSQERSYIQFTTREAQVGVEYARKHFDIDLSFDFLRDLANRTRALMEREFKTFKDARFQVLNGAGICAKTKSEWKKRKAYEGALGKMFNERKKFAKAKSTAPVKTPPNVSMDASGQFEMIF